MNGACTLVDYEINAYYSWSSWSEETTWET